ncbi:MAG: DNA polymerase III subunit delta' [Proteobacteria bacterium]|nr:DNA polymerase III subunit delta' [Pseudomonadota bacterium]
MSAPEPRNNPDLLGHQAAEALCAEAMRSARMHHAWLITGPEGIGKATLAFRFARRLLAGAPEGPSLALDAANKVFRRVAAGAHADLLTIERAWDDKRKRQRSEIVVDDVRKVTDFLRLTPAEGGWRVVIVDGAEELNRNAANALLKVLEEPPPRAVLLLTCAAPGRLLPTIRSRCRRLRLSPLPDADMERLLAAYLPDLDADARARLVTLAEGSPGRALLLAEEEGLALSQLVDQVLGALPALPASRAHVIADTLGRGEGAFSTFMDLLRAAISSAVRDVLRGRGDPEQERLVALRPLDAWGETWHALTRLQDETERFSLDKRQALVAGLGLLSPTRTGSSVTGNP